MKPMPFKIAIPDTDLDDLHRRLGAIRWPGDYGNAEWIYGVEEGWLRGMVDYWRNSYDWRAVERIMNRLPHFRADIDGILIHFVHLRSRRADAIPLMLTHGWPWSFWDWAPLLRKLAEPEDDALPAFDVIVPSLPGFAFSSPLTTTGLGVRAIGRIWQKLMCEVLGYAKFAAAGGDWGSLITSELGHAFPKNLIGVHLTGPLMPGVSFETLASAQFTADEAWMATRSIEARPLYTSHVAVQSTDPQTLAYGLADSPVGLGAWLWERRLAWSDRRYRSNAQSPDLLCTLASIYWLTNTIGSSMRIYKDHFPIPWASLTGRERAIDVPTAFAVAPRELAMIPRTLAERKVNLQRWTILPRGGHFIAAEVPDLMVEEYRSFFGNLMAAT